MKQTVLDKLEVDEKGSHVSLASSNPVFDDQSKTKTQIMHDGTGKKVAWFVSIVVRAPLLVFCAVFVLIGLCALYVLPYVDLSDPLAGLRLREDDFARKADALFKAFEEINAFWAESNAVQTAPQTDGQLFMTLLYYTDNDNVFTPERLEAMTRIEAKLRATEGYEDFCLKDEDTLECKEFRSPINNFLGTNITTQEEINAILVDSFENHKSFFAKEFDIETNQLESRLTKTVVFFGFPLPGYGSFGDSEQAQRDLLTEFLYKDGGFVDILEEEYEKTPGMRAIYIQSNIVLTIGLEQMLEDVQKCIIAVFAILVVMILHMRSVFLAGLGMVQILTSFPVAFFVYRIVFGLELFGALHCGALFIVLGVGADDCFIYLDSFKIADDFVGWTREERLSFAYDKAKFTMMVTTFTNAFAFLSLSTSAIPMVRYFGVFSFLLILANYLLVMTLFSSLIVIWDKYLRDATFKSCKVKRKTEQLKASISSNESSDQSSDNFVIAEHTKKGGVISEFIVSDKGSTAILVVFGIIIVVFFGLATRLNTSPSLSEIELFWPPDHPIFIFVKEIEAFHGSPDQEIKLFNLVGGLEDPWIDRTGTKDTDVNDLGSPVYANLNLEDVDAQDYYSFACRAVYDEKFDSGLLKLNGPPEGSAGCFMLAFELWREARNESFPVESQTVVQPLLNISFPEYASTTGDDFYDALVEFFGRPFFEPLRLQVQLEDTIEVTESNQRYQKLRANLAMLSFYVGTDPEETFNSRLKTAAEWDRVLDHIKPKQPSSIQGDVFYTEGYYFVDMQRQRLLLVTAFSALFLAFCLAFGFLILATNNIHVTLLSVLCIMGIVAVMFGFVTIIGWGVDTVTGISITILVGFAIDYVVHFAVAFDEAYREQGIEGRKDKVRYAFTTMSGSIIAGASSTLIATVLLFPTVIVIFRRFGGFLCTAVSVAIVFASVFLPASLAKFGPNGANGKLSKKLEKRMTATGSIYLKKCHQPRSTKAIKREMSLCALFFLILLVAVVTLGYFAGIIEDEEPVESFPVFGDSNVIDFDAMEAQTLYKISPGGNTTCGRGSPYSFYVKKGDANSTKFLVEFEGGGVCWNVDTCRASAQAFRADLSIQNADMEAVKRGDRAFSGVMDDNGPFSGYNYIFVPLCTGDFHWGGTTTKYSETVEVSHMGSINVISVLEWMFNQVENTTISQLSIIGSGSGAYASLVYSGIIATWLRLVDSTIHLTQHGDGGVGIFHPNFLEAIVPAWGLSVDEFEAFVIDGDNITIPSWLVLPDIGQGNLTNFTSLAFLNQTELRLCLEAANAEPSIGDFGDYLNGNIPEEVQDCINAQNVTSLDQGLLINGTAFNESQAFEDSFGFDPFDPSTFNLSSFDQDALNELLNREECFDESSEQFLNNPNDCLTLELLRSLNLSSSSFNISDFVGFDTEENLQIIPSMYLFFSYRFPEYDWAQTTSAFDYEQSVFIASQVLGFITPVRVSEQQLWHDFMTALYDFYLPLMNDNYHHYMVSGDLHGFISSNRYYRLLDNKFYQIMYSWTNELSLVAGLPENFDCRNEGSCNGTGLDERLSILYFADD